MTISKFCKKPVIIEAVQWTGSNIREVLALSRGISSIGEDFVDSTLTIETLEGNMTAILNDWIIRGIQGEIYPCKPDIFDKTYQRMSDHDD